MCRRVKEVHERKYLPLLAKPTLVVGGTGGGDALLPRDVL
jgi:hypothetical protein